MTNKPTHPYKANSHKIDDSQIDEIAQLLAIAFENGSGLSQICKAQGQELNRRLYVLFRIMLAIQAAAHRSVLTVTPGTRVAGVAVIQEPENQVPLKVQICGFLQVNLSISPAVAWQLWQSIRILERYHPPEPHHYLMFLGVHPEFQRQGYGRALLDELHARSEVHPRSTGVYLETANPKNVEFYQYFGYHLLAQVPIRDVKNYIMFRPNPSNKIFFKN